MPELLEFQEVIEAYPMVLAIVGVAVALIAAAVTRWADQKSLDTANERLAAYEEELERLNAARADLIARLEERGDDLRRARAELASRPRARSPGIDAPRVAAAEVAALAFPAPGAEPSRDPSWRR